MAWGYSMEQWRTRIYHNKRRRRRRQQQEQQKQQKQQQQQQQEQDLRRGDTKGSFVAGDAGE